MRHYIPCGASFFTRNVFEQLHVHVHGMDTAIIEEGKLCSQGTAIEG